MGQRRTHARLRWARIALATAAAGVAHVSLDAAVAPQDNHVDAKQLESAYDASVHGEEMWGKFLTGSGVGVAVIDSGIDGDLPDFRVSQNDPASRVIAAAVTN